MDDGTPNLSSDVAARALLDWWTMMGVEPLEPLHAGRAAAVNSTPQAPSGTRALAHPAASPRRLDHATNIDASRPGVAVALPPSATRVDDSPPDTFALAAKAQTLEALREAISALDIPLSRGALNMVFARGQAGAPVMVIGEAPGREEDREGLPFVGPSGQLLDRMLASIGLSAQHNAYITNIVNWRPPGNRTPSLEEMALCRPLIARHIALAQPKLILTVGGVATQTLLEVSEGIMKTHGRWQEYRDRDQDAKPVGPVIPTMPLFHPAFVLRAPVRKREVWRDLLRFQDRLLEMGLVPAPQTLEC